MKVIGIDHIDHATPSSDSMHMQRVSNMSEAKSSAKIHENQSLIRRCSYYFFRCSFWCHYSLRAAFIYLESPLTSTAAGYMCKLRMSNTVTTVRCCPAVSNGNESYNTNSPSTSLLTIVRIYLHTCTSATYTNCGYNLRAAFILLRASNSAATTRGWHLFEEIRYMWT